MAERLANTFLLHGGSPDIDDGFFEHLLQLGAERTLGKLSLTLYPAPRHNDTDFREDIRQRIERLSGGNCVVQELLLGEVLDGEPTPADQIESLCANPDIFLITGGDTRHASRLAYENNVPGLLEQASANGTFMAGWSCGAIIHGIASVSDSNAFSVDEPAGESWKWLTISREQATTFGSIEAIICAHDGQVRDHALPHSSRSEMHRMLVADQAEDLPAFLIPENMAL